MPTCTAPTLPTTPDRTHHEARPGRCGLHPNDLRAADCLGSHAPAPLTCQGPTTWPPPTAHQTYAEDRRLGQRVPPSVSVWRPEDVRRQQEADARIRARATDRLAVVVPGEGPACEPEPCRPAHMIGVRS